MMTSATSILSLPSGRPAFRNDGNPLLARGPGTLSGKNLLFRATVSDNIQKM